jgi:hypothetical protein
VSSSGSWWNWRDNGALGGGAAGAGVRHGACPRCVWHGGETGRARRRRRARATRRDRRSASRSGAPTSTDARCVALASGEGHGRVDVPGRSAVPYDEWLASCARDLDLTDHPPMARSTGRAALSSSTRRQDSSSSTTRRSRSPSCPRSTVGRRPPTWRGAAGTTRPAPRSTAQCSSAWHDRYGADVVSLAGDVLEVRVRRGPGHHLRLRFRPLCSSERRLVVPVGPDRWFGLCAAGQGSTSGFGL